MAHRFIRYVFRTTDAVGARAFYTAVFGPHFITEPLSMQPLSEQALARGARPSWLGHIGVDEVDATTTRMITEGGQQLGPTWDDAEGRSITALRDPFGAMLALTTTQTVPERKPVALHIMHSADVQRAFALYATLFHWEAREVLEMGAGVRLQTFAWDGSGNNAGSITNMAGQQGIHAQWLYFFPVDDIEAAAERVRTNGGLALDIIRTEKSLLAGCDDAQGAAFGLYQALR